MSEDNDRSKDRLPRRVTLAMSVVLAATTGFALWSSQYTYAAAAPAVAAEESLERKYRLEPGTDVRDRYEAAATDLLDALALIRTLDTVHEVALVDRVVTLHSPYLDAIDRMFRAVDRGDTAAVLQIDGDEVDPLFGEIETLVDDAADLHHARSQAALARLQSVERFTATATPLVFLLGVVFIGGFASVLRRVRRQPDAHRRQAMHDSMHDALTGLPNRVLLADRFDQTLRAERRTRQTTGLLLIDLDRFKEINDTLGHDYGDELLTQIGPRIATALRDADTVARLGGDEFAVLLPDAGSVADALVVADRIRQALTAPFTVNGVELGIDASIGAVTSGDHGQDPTTLLQRADVAMYVAKAQGIGIRAYDPTIDGHSRDRLALLGELRHALDRDELFLDYQPKVALATGDVCGVEALVRWSTPFAVSSGPPDRRVCWHTCSGPR